MADDIETEVAIALAEQAGFDWDKLNTNQRDSWRPHARAALAVMRARMENPTPEMVEAGRKAMDEDWSADGLHSFVLPEVACFRAMAGVMLGENDG